MGAVGQNSPGGKRLDSWKEIGAFFQRDERTVKRWEATRGLPVHRVPGGGRVYAYTNELTAWLESGQAKDEVTPPIETPAPQQPIAVSVPAPALEVRRQRRISPAFVAIVSVVLLGGIFLLVRPPWRRRTEALQHAPVHKPDPKAQELYLAGIYYWHKRTPESLNQAVDAFTQAIVVDPDYAPAYVGLADCYNLLREYSSLPESEAYPRAISAARRAIALDDSLAGAHSSLAFAEFYWTWQIPEAEHEFQRAIALSPNSVQAHHWYATSLVELVRFPEAQAEIERAQTLDPQSTPVLADKGLILYLSGQKNEGISILKNVEASEPAFLSSHEYMAMIALLEGQDALYVAESRKTAEMRHDADRMAVVEAAARGLAKGGRRTMLSARLDAQRKLYAKEKLAAYPLAETCALLGDNQGALQYLEESFSKHDPSLVGIRVSPMFSGLHADPQFRELVRKIGLPTLP